MVGAGDGLADGHEFLVESGHVPGIEGIEAQLEGHDIASLECLAAVGAAGKADEFRFALANPRRADDQRGAGTVGGFLDGKGMVEDFAVGLAEEIAFGIASGLFGEEDEGAAGLAVHKGDARRAEIVGEHFQAGVLFGIERQPRNVAGGQQAVLFVIILFGLALGVAAADDAVAVAVVDTARKHDVVVGAPVGKIKGQGNTGLRGRAGIQLERGGQIKRVLVVCDGFGAELADPFGGGGFGLAIGKGPAGGKLRTAVPADQRPAGAAQFL